LNFSPAALAANRTRDPVPLVRVSRCSSGARLDGVLASSPSPGAITVAAGRLIETAKPRSSAQVRALMARGISTVRKWGADLSDVQDCARRIHA